MLSHTNGINLHVPTLYVFQNIDKMVVHNKQNTKYTNPLGFNTFMANSRKAPMK